MAPSEKISSLLLNTAARDDLLLSLQEQTFDYFLHECNPANGLIADKSGQDAPASIAATGFALSCYPVGVKRGFMNRADAAGRTLTTLRFFQDSEQSEARNATGYRGFYYHFLNMEDGRRAERSELSSVDTALLIAGVLTVRAYFDRDTALEREIRRLADELYQRVDWWWMLNGTPLVAHGWKPERGFMPYHWQGYNEGLLIYLLALGSPTHPIKFEGYEGWLQTYLWKKIYGYEYLYAGPLFIHQYTHCWIDFRGIRDAFMREKECDYFENSRRATYVQREYAIRNPRNHECYDATCWGISSSDGPGPALHIIKGRKHRFFDYRARGVPFGPDDGTIAPWATAASLPFAPEIVLPAIERFVNFAESPKPPYCFESTFNLTFQHANGNPYGWSSKSQFGINQGALLLMVENYRSELIWQLLRDCDYIRTGLQRAGFRGGWLNHKE